MELSSDEQFTYKRAWWTPTRHVARLRLYQFNSFAMFYRNRRGAIRSITRDGFAGNTEFEISDVPNMPEAVRLVAEQNMKELREQHIFANAPTNRLF